MKNEDKIVELLAEMVQKIDQTNQNQKETNHRLESLEKQMARLNAQSKENARAIVRLADKIEDYAKHEEPIQKLEKVFK